MIYYACDIPEDLTYDVERDVWIRFEGDTAVLGMTDIAQTRCGKITAISFRDIGKKVVQGKVLATVESAKWVGYTKGWLLRVRHTSLETERAHLVTGEAAVEKYKARIQELKINCLRCIE